MKKKIGNWGNYPVIESNAVYFRSIEILRAELNRVPHTMARGNGRCYGDAALWEHTISTKKFNKVIGFDTLHGWVDVQSGVGLDEILSFIVPAGWFLPVTPGTKYITVGGAVASDVHGKNHHVDGCFSKHIIDMDLMTATGELVTCSRTTNPDLFHATCGGMGLTGMITRVKFGLKRIETAFIKQRQIKAANLDEVLRLFEENKHYTYSVAWIDCLQKGESFGRSILILGEHALRADLPKKVSEQPLAIPEKKQIRFPFFLPSWALNAITVKLFNSLYYAKNTKKIIDNTIPYEPFFYPLDAVLDWNKGYGKKGFLQYQFVLPLSEKEGLIRILSKISEAGMGSFLAVLKVFGPQNDLISFPMEGYTLALDFPIRANLFPFLDELDSIVRAHQGRIYMSKDARMTGEMLRAGYPQLEDFLKIVRKYNTGNKFISLQSERLALI
jgi:decaprenylphospho-beta-D-ribofuranose 2-oxidase